MSQNQRRLSLCLLAATAALAPALAQSNSPGTDQSLKIFVLQGDRVVHRPGLASQSDPVVEVRDANDLPVEGAEVQFRAPGTGPGGFFAQNSLTATARTNAQGQATAPFTSNGRPGAFAIEVRATHRNRTGEARLAQRNAAAGDKAEFASQRGKAGWLRSWKFWGVVAGGAAAGVAAGTRGGGTGSATVTPTITVTPGTPTIGGPR